MTDQEAYDLAQDLDEGVNLQRRTHFSIAMWEASFLESILRSAQLRCPVSEGRKRILEQMRARYLD